MYEWYNNGKRNKKIFKGQSIPDSYIKGYILTKDAIKRIAKLNKQYEEKKRKYEEYWLNKIKLKKKALDLELRKKQDKITKLI